eukprot:1859450-Amphidinium_carterae.1
MAPVLSKLAAFRTSQTGTNVHHVLQHQLVREGYTPQLRAVTCRILASTIGPLAARRMPARNRCKARHLWHPRLCRLRSHTTPSNRWQHCQRTCAVH